mmetsp:Transcript_13125/g.35948  ORF Transcript_13125/g.35948 Transcript_13125/m.35948 type:complete len:689 (+) Transcript_13125:210-2276(+)
MTPLERHLVDDVDALHPPDVLKHGVRQHLRRVLHDGPKHHVHPHVKGEGPGDTLHAVAEGPVDAEHGGGPGGENERTDEHHRGRAGPHPALAPGVKHGEVIRQRNLQVHQALNLAVRQLGQAHRRPAAVRVDRGQRVGQQDERGQQRRHADRRGHDVEDVEIPLLRQLRGVNVVVRDGDDGAVVEDGDGDERDDGDVKVRGPVLVVLVGVVEDAGPEEEEQELLGARDSVNHEVLHALENLAAGHDGGDDGGETGLGEHDVRRSLRRVRRALHRDTDVRALERGRVVHAVARHAHHEALLAQRLDDEVLVLGVNLGKAVSAAAELAVVPAEGGALLEVRRLHQGELVGTEDVGAHAEDAARLHGDGLVVAGDHLNGDAKVVGAIDGVLGVGPRRVEEGEDTDKLEGSAGGPDGAGDREGSDAAVRELHNLGLNLGGDLRLVVAQVQHDVGRTLGHLHHLTRRLILHGRLRALDRGIEGHVVGLIVVVEGANVDGVEHEGVERILGGLPPLGGERGELEHVVPVQTLDEDGEILLEHHLVEGQGARLVGAQDGHARELLDGGEARDDGLLGGELVASQREGGGAHNPERDGNGRDEEDDVEREHLPEIDADVEQVAKHDETDDGTRGDQDDHDLAEHLLKVSELVDTLHQVRRLAEEGLGARGGHGRLDLTAGQRGSHLGLGARVHRHR